DGHTEPARRAERVQRRGHHRDDRRPARARQAVRGALHRAGRQRPGLLRRRRPQLDEAHRGLHARTEHRGRERAGAHAGSPLQVPAANHRARAWRRVRGRHRPGGRLRHRGGGRHRAVLPERSAAGPGTGHDQPLRDPFDGRPRRPPLVPHRGTLLRGRSAPHRLRARGGACRAARCEGAGDRAGPGECRARGGEGLQAAGARRGRPRDHQRPGTADRGRHRRHPGQRRGPRGHPVLPGKAQAQLAAAAGL
ncbi:MAG: Methylglutaconyl-CoA hydratase, partial [uncultured Ramlibacter sp.]